MTLPQLAAFLDQLKRPIEEAPMYPSSPPVLAEKCNGDWWLVDNIRETETYGWVGDEYLTRDDEVDHLAYFLPLPAPGPVEFEVVPVGTVENTVESAYKEGYHNGLKHGKNYEGSYPNFSWIASDAREAAERSYLRGLETGAEVQRVEDEAK